MASTQPLTKLRAELAKHQRAYQNLVKKVDTRNKKYEEEVRGMDFTAEQIACRKETMNQLLDALYNEFIVSERLLKRLTRK